MVGGVVVEQLGTATPVDGDVEWVAGLGCHEAAEQVEEGGARSAAGCPPVSIIAAAKRQLSPVMVMRALSARPGRKAANRGSPAAGCDRRRPDREYPIIMAAGMIGGVGSALLRALATAAVLAAGCGCSADPQRAPTPLPSTVATPSRALPAHRLGEKVQAGTGFLEVTVYAYQQPVAAGAPADQPGLGWGAADVQACSSASSIFEVSVSAGPWSLVYIDGTSISPSKAGHPQFPQPAYPATPRRLQPGECLRGWIVFAVPSATAPQWVRYAQPDAVPLSWSTR